MINRSLINNLLKHLNLIHPGIILLLSTCRRIILVICPDDLQQWNG